METETKNKRDEKFELSLDDLKAYLKTSSKRAGLLSLAGIVIIVAALLFSAYYLSNQVVESQKLSREIEDKQRELTESDRKLSERKKDLQETEKAFLDYQNAVENKFPGASKVALEETIKENPQAKEIIQDIKTSVTPKTSVSPVVSVTPNPVSSDKLKIAQAKEREGFQALISGNYDVAIAAFQESENIYPSYHNVYELARILRKNKAQMNDPVKKKEVFQTISNQYSYGAPPDSWAQVKSIANQ